MRADASATCSCTQHHPAHTAVRCCSSCSSPAGHRAMLTWHESQSLVPGVSFSDRISCSQLSVHHFFLHLCSFGHAPLFVVCDQGHHRPRRVRRVRRPLVPRARHAAPHTANNLDLIRPPDGGRSASPSGARRGAERALGQATTSPTPRRPARSSSSSPATHVPRQGPRGARVCQAVRCVRLDTPRR